MSSSGHCSCTPRSNSSKPSALDRIDWEYHRRVCVWGVQGHLSLSACLAILVEEIGEAAKEINDMALAGVTTTAGAERLRTELVQAAAVAVAMIEHLTATINQSENHNGENEGRDAQRSVDC